MITNDTVPEEKSYPAKKPNVLLDYITVYPADAVKVQEHCIIEEPVASDHRPAYSKVLL